MRAWTGVASGDSRMSESLSSSIGLDLRRKKEGEFRLEGFVLGEAALACWMVMDGTVAALGDRVRVGTAVLLVVAFAMPESRLRSLLDCDVWRAVVSSMAAIVFLAAPADGVFRRYLCLRALQSIEPTRCSSCQSHTHMLLLRVLKSPLL
jgi:hypothetical protein